MSTFLRSLIIVTCMTSMASAQSRDASDKLPPSGYADSGWVVLVGSYRFPSSAQDKANDINNKFGKKYGARVVRIPNTLVEYTVLIGPEGSSLNDAARLKFNADSDELAAEITIWQLKTPFWQLKTP